MMSTEKKFVINVGRQLKGEIEVGGAKNAAFPIVAAALLTKEECLISNLPLIEDVFRLLEILKGMGVKVDWVGERGVKIMADDFDPSKIREDIVSKLRGSILLFGPLLARFSSVKLRNPGGCVIGARPIDTHLDGFSQLGVKVFPEKRHYTLQIKEKQGG